MISTGNDDFRKGDIVVDDGPDGHGREGVVTRDGVQVYRDPDGYTGAPTSPEWLRIVFVYFEHGSTGYPASRLRVIKRVVPLESARAFDAAAALVETFPGPRGREQRLSVPPPTPADAFAAWAARWDATTINDTLAVLHEYGGDQGYYSPNTELPCKRELFEVLEAVAGPIR